MDASTMAKTRLALHTVALKKQHHIIRRLVYEERAREGLQKTSEKNFFQKVY